MFPISQPLFTSETEAQAFLGSLDAIFMGAYALVRLLPFIIFLAGLVLLGMVRGQDQSEVRRFGWNVRICRCCTSPSLETHEFQLTLFGAVPKLTSFYSIPYYIVTYIFFGILQACGWPNEISIMVTP